MASEVIFPKFFENDLKSLENVHICLKRLFLADLADFPNIFCKLTMWKCVEEMTALGISSLKTQSPYLTSLGGRSHFADILQIGRKTFKKRIFLPKNTVFSGFWPILQKCENYFLRDILQI